MSHAETIGIVGATSPLGIHLVDFLEQRGYEVHAGYRLHEHVPKRWWLSSRIICVKAELEDQETLKSAYKGCSTVVWLSHRQQGRNNKREVRLNTIPFDWFCRQISKLGLQKLVFISSGGSVYGNSIIIPIPENQPRNPISTYGMAKKEMEEILNFHENRTCLATAVLRPGNIYGPEYLSPCRKGTISAFFQSICTHKPVTLIADGTAIRDFVHVCDVVQAILCAIKLGQKKIVWNVGSGTGYSVSHILKLVCNALDCRDPVIVHQPAYDTDVTTNVLSTNRIREECGWKAEIKVQQGIEALAELTKKQANKYVG